MSDSPAKRTVPKRTVRQNVWGNWRGYEGGRFVREFGNSTTQTAEQAARQWAEQERSK